MVKRHEYCMIESSAPSLISFDLLQTLQSTYCVDTMYVKLGAFESSYISPDWNWALLQSSRSWYL